MNENASDITPLRKQETLFERLGRFDALAVAFSGGVDSTFLLWAAREVLRENTIALTAVCPLHPARDLDASRKTARRLGVRQIEFPSREMASRRFRANPVERCYLCKRMLLEDMRAILRNLGVRNLAHGVNVDDLADFRPGQRAAREAGAYEPLVEAGLTKAAIRTLSRAAGLDGWNRPAMACLATRIPYGTEIREEDMARIAEAENYLFEEGFDGCRVRLHGDMARIEVPASRIKALAGRRVREDLVQRLREIGFGLVTLDMEEYVQGKMNRFPSGPDK